MQAMTFGNILWGGVVGVVVNAATATAGGHRRPARG